LESQRRRLLTSRVCLPRGFRSHHHIRPAANQCLVTPIKQLLRGCATEKTGGAPRTRFFNNLLTPPAMQSVSLPVWLLVILGLFAAWAAMEHVVLPALRWIVRRRVEAVLQELGPRLQVEIPPLKLARREVLIERLRHDERVHAAVEQEAARSGEPVKRVQARAEGYAREIVPSFNAYLYFRVGYWLARGIARSLYRVRLGFADEAGLAAIEPKSTVVFVMNHRSNFDTCWWPSGGRAPRYLMRSASGARWPLDADPQHGRIFRAPRFRRPLIGRAQRYVQMATEAGLTQAVFPEGGLSVDGCVRKPKLGLLDYMVRGFDPSGPRDVVFVPVGINYDRVLEDRALLRKHDPTASPVGFARTLFTAIGFALRQATLRLRGRWFRFGYACVSFGTPLSLRQHTRALGIDPRTLPQEQRRAHLEALGLLLMDRVKAIIPVLPVALVAQVFRERGDRPMEALRVKAEAFALGERLALRRAVVYLPRGDQDYAIEVGLRMLVLRRIVLEERGLFSANPAEQHILDYYANSISHFLA
jgi:glycerol-3-phosphate O-acyltransferase